MGCVEHKSDTVKVIDSITLKNEREEKRRSNGFDKVFLVSFRLF